MGIRGKRGITHSVASRRRCGLVHKDCRRGTGLQLTHRKGSKTGQELIRFGCSKRCPRKMMGKVGLPDQTFNFSLSSGRSFRGTTGLVLRRPRGCNLLVLRHDTQRNNRTIYGQRVNGAVLRGRIEVTGVLRYRVSASTRSVGHICFAASTSAGSLLCLSPSLFGSDCRRTIITTRNGMLRRQRGCKRRRLPPNTRGTGGRCGP